MRAKLNESFTTYCHIVKCVQCERAQFEHFSLAIGSVCV